MAADGENARGAAGADEAGSQVPRGSSLNNDGLQNIPNLFISPIAIAFYDLRANSEVRIGLGADDPVRWVDAHAGSRLVGVCLAASPRGTTLGVSRFILNAKELLIGTFQLCSEIRVRLYAQTLDAALAGHLSLPPGASATLESPIDRTTLTERGSVSFSLKLR